MSILQKSGLDCGDAGKNVMRNLLSESSGMAE